MSTWSSIFRRATGPDRRGWVRLVEPAGRLPTSEIERLAAGRLARDSSVAFDVLAAHVAAEIYRRALQRGGWVVDLGLVGSSVFVPDVVRELEAAAGVLWTIGPGDAAARHPGRGAMPGVRT
ncbi:MAG: hypothetical protein HY614_10250 [Candidatus Rokubacteria bacterium]|nr:hypothetical protein [Candidatus Rokubacteria bacterium]